MCYDPLFGDLYLRDEIARELLDEYARETDPAATRSRSARDTETGDETADVDILTGGAASE